MKKAVVGFVAVGAVLAVRPVARRMGEKAREHCKQMMAGQFGGPGEAAGRTMGPKMAMAPEMREHWEQMAARFEDRGEAVGKK